MRGGNQQRATGCPLMTSAYGQRFVRPGFSLVELLTIIAIVAMLMAILLPSLRNAREQAKRLACQSNLHQVAIAWDAYLMESDGRFLRAPNANVNYGGQQGLQPAFQVPKPLNRFVGLDEVTTQGAESFLCPNDSGSTLIRPSSFVFHGTSYDTNPFLIGQDQTPFWRNRQNPCRAMLYQVDKRLPGLTRSRVSTSEARLVLLGDYGWVQRWDIGSTQRIEWHNRAGHYNLAFMDGHVRFQEVGKGIHVNSDYSVLPFSDLETAARGCQGR